jgi:hypothetical protein
MKKILFLLIVLTIIFKNSYSQNINSHLDSRNFNVDLSNPESVLKGFIEGITTANFDLILYVTDPLIEENPKLSKSEISKIRKGLINKDPETIKILKESSKKLSININGIVGYSKDKEYAYVPCIIIKNKNGNSTTLKKMAILINRNSKWYIMSTDQDYDRVY